jgi:hypothetical protein
MQTLDIILDNPILTKHMRSRLRRAQVVPWIVVVVVLSATAAWAGEALRWFGPVYALGALLFIQMLILGFSGAQVIGATVGGARQSGIMEFHRVSPLPPLWMAVGFFLGGPIREYVLFACTIPFVIWSAARGPAGFLGLIQLEIALLLAIWALHAVSLLGSLVTNKPRGVVKGGGIGALIFILMFVGRPLMLLMGYASGSLQTESVHLEFFGVQLPWLPFVLLYEIPIIGFVFTAAARKMQSDRAHAFSKPLDLACMATLTLLAVGGSWSIKQLPYLTVGLTYVMVLLAAFLIPTITPGRTEYIRGVRRALRHGRHRPSPWTDAGTNSYAVFGLCAIVLIGATAAWEVIEGRVHGDRGVYSQTIAIGVFVVAYVGLGLQYFALRASKPGVGQTWFVLFLFLVWLVPVIAGAVATGTLSTSEPGLAVMAISPLAGIALSVGIGQPQNADVVRLAAIAPAVTFACIFNFLLVALQRKIDLSVRTGESKQFEPPDRPSGASDGADFKHPLARPAQLAT